MAQNEKALGVIALAMNAKFAAIKAGVTADFDGHEAASAAWVVEQAADKSAFEAAYEQSKADNNTANLAALAAAEAAVDAAADLVANNPDIAINSILEAEAEMLQNKADADAFKVAALAEMEGLRTAASDKMGVIGDFTNSVAAAWDTVVISGGESVGDGGAPVLGYDVATFIGGTYPNISPEGDEVANQIIHPSIIGQTLPVIFTVQNPSGESGIPHTNFSTIENMFRRYSIKKDSNESPNISQGIKDFWEWYMDLNNAPDNPGGNFADPKFDAVKNKWAELMVPVGYTATNEGSSSHPEDVFLYLGKAQWAWGNLSKKGYQDVAYEKAGWKSDAIWFLTTFQTAFQKIQEMQTPSLSYYDAFASQMAGHLETWKMYINTALAETSGYYYNGEGVGENLL